MKRTFRIAGLCALMALAAVSCKKSESVNGSVTVRATITQPTSDSKTHTDGVSVLWNQNDQIVVYTADKDNPQLFTTSANNVADATFSGDMEVTDGCYAFYPAEGVSVINDDHFKLPLSAIQTLTANSFSTATYPMCAVYANDKFEFHSPYGLLALQLQGTACIGSIELTSGDADEKLSGYYEISDDEPVFHGEDVSVTLSCSEGLQLTSEVTTVYFVLPGGTLGNNFSIVVKDTEGTELLNKASSVTTNIVAAEYILVMPALTVNAASVVDLSTLTGDYEAQNGQVLIGTLDGYKQITVADGATVTLRNATIAHEPNPDYYYAGIACVGDATIVLEGTNTVQPCFVYMPSIHVSPNHTLTLRGTGSLAATVTSGMGAAIGAGQNHPCGNIVIESGTITASAYVGAGIGGSYNTGSCGDITILGGTVNATSQNSAGIGANQSSSCGNISILGGSVTAKGGSGAANIGSASGGNCGNHQQRHRCGHV